MKKQSFLFTWAVIISLAGAGLPLTSPVVQASPTEWHVCSTCTYTNPQAAVDAANAGDVIKIAAGTYTGVTTKNGLKQVVYINKALSLEGGFNPTNWTTADPVSNTTVLDAQSAGRVLYITSHSQDVTITGLQLINGDATQAADLNSLGGAVYAAGWDQKSTLTFTNNVVQNNYAHEGGGGVAFWQYQVVISQNTFSGNTTLKNTNGDQIAGGGANLNFCSGQVSANYFLNNLVPTDDYYGDEGGGLYLQYSTMTVSDNIFNGNQAEQGGGLSAMGEPVTVTNNQFISNTAIEGGGLYFGDSLNHTAILTLTYNLFSKNSISEGGAGGGAWINAYQSTVTQNTFTQNTASGDAGGLLIEGPAEVDDNRFLNNTASLTGGGLESGGQPVFNRNILQGNTANQGGGVALFGGGISGSILLNNNVITDNTAKVAGSGAYLGGSTSTLNFTTFARNSGGDGSVIYVDQSNGNNSTLTLTNTILAAGSIGIAIQNGSTGTVDGILWYQVTTPLVNPANITINHQISGDPKFQADGYHIQQTSAAYDQAVVSTVAIDFDHQHRPNSVKPDGKSDLGADEWYPPLKYIYLPTVIR